MSTLHTHRQIFEALEAKSLRNRSWSTVVADNLTSLTGNPGFLYLNIALFAVWVGINIGLVPGIPVFDPFPFGLLTMFVSLEAIMLSIFVLISQNRAAQIATLREELHLRLNIIAEQEITKTLEMLVKVQEKMGILENDEELERMLEKVNPAELEISIQRQLARADRSVIRAFVGDIEGVLNTGTSKKEGKNKANYR